MSAALLHRRMPRPRKITLGIVLSMAFTNSVLLIVTLVRPVPQFSSSGTLMTISAMGNMTLGEQDILLREKEEEEDAVEEAGAVGEADFEGQSGIAEARELSRRALCESCKGENEDTVDDDDDHDDQVDNWLLDDENDETSHKHKEKEVKKSQSHEDSRQDRNDESDDGNFLILEENEEEEEEETDTKSEGHTSKKVLSTRVLQPGTIPLYDSQTSQTPTRITASTTSSTTTAMTVSANHTLAALPQTGAEPASLKFVPDGFVEIWIGPLGVCIRRGNGTIACSIASMNADFLPAYKQAGLNQDIRNRLPQSINGLSVALLLAGVVYMICTGVFAYTLAPPFNLKTAYGPQRNMDVRHQTALAINTVLSSLALFLVMIPTFTLRGKFLKVVDTIPAFDVDLQARLGGAFAQLYACAILGALIVLQSILLISEDLRHPWWVLYNTRWENPFTTSRPAIDFTAHRQLRHLQEVRVAEELARLQAVRRAQANTNSYEETDGFGTYAPTRFEPSEAPPPIRPATSAYMASRGQEGLETSQYLPYMRGEMMKRFTGSVAPSAAHVPLRRYTASAAPSGVARSRAVSHM